ncbi:toll/interleukin-1 receptor domain-containing protein [Rhodococcus erythropolis]|uniref:toll/interleukin-1 receptor domain-containing protein n=1 Tax=Rhodococcus erythropolis TaxID=1833 RepID=UPI000AC6D342|nr:toll/interleukin-1 receptor domain-containing protein [Rhodococcus erythropolis]MBO8147755.1 toll/interleukin-1 receptor domain-containing protein [Rhodococcus erythropolis]MDO1489013.1 toll/interleukin-1 receptor domain-containing protein [Rhodococcus erythropolis]
MKVFISHAAIDAPIAAYLTESLGRNLGLTFFLMPRDSPPGLPWIDQIKHGLDQCDVLWSIVTPNSADRPWISAEWACFWYQSKPTVPLLAGVGFEILWEPMKAYPSVTLDDVTSVTQFLRSVADETKSQPQSGVVPLAAEIVREVPAIQQRQLVANLEEVFGRLGRDIRSGTDNIRQEDVRALVLGNRLDELLKLATSHEAVSVKQRQVAMALLESGRTGEAGTLANVISNRAEARTIAVQIVRRILRGASLESEEWQVLNSLYDRLGVPQRRDVLFAMEEAGVAPLGRWASGPRPVN